MKWYLWQSPILCVRSKDFFEFQARRMLELFNVQLHMAKHRSANYGTVTSVLMHLIKLVNHTPIPMAPYLCDALKDLHYDQVVERFGMFFLHELDLRHGTIGGIDLVDSAACQYDMGRSKLARKPPPAKALLTDADPTAQFPLGSCPTWADIVHVLHHEPLKLVREWMWDPNIDFNAVASGLFVNFTKHYWLTIQGSALLGDIPNPRDLEEAMAVWTVSSLVERLSEVTFLASNHGLRGKFHGKRHQGFRDWMTVFFPGRHAAAHRHSVWRELAQGGYIGEYHKVLESIGELERRSLTSTLEEIFANLQCIPNALPTTSTSPGRLWITSDAKIEFWVNPVHYMIEKVSPGSRKQGTVYRIKAARDVIAARLATAVHGEDLDRGIQTARRRKRMEKRVQNRASARTRNKRMPPRRKQIQKGVSTDQRSGEDEERCPGDAGDKSSNWERQGGGIEDEPPSAQTKNKRMPPRRKQKGVTTEEVEDSCPGDAGDERCNWERQGRDIEDEPPSAQTKNKRMPPRRKQKRVSTEEVEDSCPGDAGDDSSNWERQSGDIEDEPCH